MGKITVKSDFAMERHPRPSPSDWQSFKKSGIETHPTPGNTTSLRGDRVSRTNSETLVIEGRSDEEDSSLESLVCVLKSISWLQQIFVLTDTHHAGLFVCAHQGFVVEEPNLG